MAIFNSYVKLPEGRNEGRDIQAAKKGFERSKCQVVSYCSLIIPNIILKNGDKTNPSQNRLPRFYLGWLYKLYNLSFWQICGKSYVSTYIWLYKLYNLYTSAKKNKKTTHLDVFVSPRDQAENPCWSAVVLLFRRCALDAEDIDPAGWGPPVMLVGL